MRSQTLRRTLSLCAVLSISSFVMVGTANADTSLPFTPSSFNSPGAVYNSNSQQVFGDTVTYSPIILSGSPGNYTWQTRMSVGNPDYLSSGNFYTYAVRAYCNTPYTSDTWDTQRFGTGRSGQGFVDITGTSSCSAEPKFVLYNTTSTGGFDPAAFNDGPPISVSGPPPPRPIANVAAGNCILSDVQIVGVARAAGFTEPQIPTITAIVLAESRGRVNATNRNTNGSIDYGLSQVNDIAHPSYDPVLLGTNPLYNLSAALSIHNDANGFTPWVTYNRGIYSKYVSRANTAVTENGGASFALTDCSGGTANPGDTNGDGQVDNPNGDPTSDEESNCKLSFNPLQYLKCLFVPTASFTQWADFKENARTKPPLSLLTGAYSLTTETLTTYNYCVNDPQQNCNETPREQINIKRLTNPGSTTIDYNNNNQLNNTISFPILGKAYESAQDPTYQEILSIVRWFLWGGFAFFVFVRITKSFGGKDTTGDSE